MWFKPSEISNGTYSAYGFENGASGYSTVAGALQGWQNSPGHNDVILNQGIWSGYTWLAMGVGIDTVSRYYYLWFSTMTDPHGVMAPCAGSDVVFSDGFEGGNLNQWSSAQP